MAKKLKGKGKPFVKGVSILDSDPTAYKYVKKKYKMHLLGGSFDWGALANTALGIYSSISNKKKVDALIKANNAEAKAEELKAKMDAYNKALLNLKDKSSIVNMKNAWDVANSIYSNMENLYDDLNTLLLLLSDSNIVNSAVLFGTQLFDFIKNSKKAPQNSFFENYVKQQKASV